MKNIKVMADYSSLSLAELKKVFNQKKKLLRKNYKKKKKL